ncbi:MAG: DNA gyrase subunit A [Planctomycetes bacterium]|jgi:DNA gyrase subunit A|nr:DNA gyrase subunit A [Planctomycetota bacterium]MBT6968337.1 DNA gyrase subunit A [Planctomycetota bacterium]MBT7103129.1 DNA gyrase subunit A [Planctomycetota bacterium]MBT7129600.1 DNA gyrase subunit A [Planctomycetota bacterium]
MTDQPRIQSLSLEEEMKSSYLTYAMSVIIQRALPDVRDGLKPSQRRILVAMNDLNLGPRSKHRKCAKVAGDTSGNYHPHGESVIYPTLVRMAQPFNMRQTMVDGQGNFGSIDGDPPAAMRYTEARMTEASTEMLADIDKETVDFVRNYDDTRDEPTVLPGKFPNLLVNGGSGIAVGMSTNFAPHNLQEVCSALLMVLDNPDVQLAELMEVIEGPDFPTGGVVCGRRGILDAYSKGRGLLTLRAKTHFEDVTKQKEAIVITEIPYQVSKAKLAGDIAGLVKDGRVTGVSDIRDESDRTGIRLVVELKRDENAQVILNQLFKHTQLQTTFGIQQIALVNGRPRTLTLLQLLHAYRDHRGVVIRRRSRHLLAKAERKAHILDGLIIATDNIDRIIELIRSKHSEDEARDAMMAEFGLTRIQSDAILRMQLRRLTGLEREKLQGDLGETREEINYHRTVLTDDSVVRELIREDIHDLRDRFKDARRTRFEEAAEDINYADLIAEEDVVVTLTHQGYVKRTPLTSYRSQGRGGRGVSGGSVREDDFVKNLFVAGTHDTLLLFSDRGKVYWLKVYQLPDMTRTAKGKPVVHLLQLEKEEKILRMIRVAEFDDRQLLFATRLGKVKKTPLVAYSRPKKTGIKAIKINDEDQLIGVAITSGEDEVVLSTASGMSIRFTEKDARPMGRDAAGVNGISLGKDDQVVSMTVVEDEGALLTVCKHGFGKKTMFSEYRMQKRGGKGLIDIRTTKRNGAVVSAKALSGDCDAMLMTSAGMLVRISLADVRPIGRNTQGVRLIKVKKDDQVIGMELVESAADEPEFEQEQE